MQSRRDFLKRTGLAAGALSVLPGASLQAASGNEKKLGVCLVGLGGYSTGRLAPALQLTEHCELRGIVTGSRYKIPYWKEKYGIPDGNVYGYTYMEQIAKNPDIDVVYIVLPTGMHAEYAIKAANAGKHVWLEKPMAMNPAECRAIIAACERNKVKLSIGYRMQHEPNTRRLMQWAEDKKYGQVRRVHATLGYTISEDANNWHLTEKLGGGYIYDLGVYPINAIRYATGEEPIAVTGKNTTVRHRMYRNVPEITEFELEFASGLRATGKSSANEMTHLLDIEYTNGAVTIDNYSQFSGMKGKTSDGLVIEDKAGNQIARQMDNDALAILNDTPVLVPGEEGLRDIAIIEAILLSARLAEKVHL